MSKNKLIKSKENKANKYKRGGDNTQLMNDAYDATASVGRIMSWVNLLVGIFIGIIFITIGIVVLRNKSQTYNGKTNAKITKVECTGSGKNSSCTLTVKYDVNGKSYSVNILKDGVYNVDQTISIKYNLSNPQDITTETVSNTTIGWILIGLGLIIIIGVSVWTYVVQKNKTVAAASGVGNIVGIASSGFDGNNEISTDFAPDLNN